MAAGGAIVVAWRLDGLAEVLLGEWTLERTIDTGVTVSGHARFTPQIDGRLRYREDGRMRLADGAELDAYADYLFEADNAGVSMLFAEQPPRLFQAFTLAEENGALVGESIHDCPPDLYASRIVFEADGSLSLTHRVSGPRKAYVSQTLYRRG